MSEINSETREKFEKKFREANNKKYEERIRQIVYNNLTEGMWHRDSFAKAIAYEITEEFIMISVDEFVDLMLKKLEK